MLIDRVVRLSVAVQYCGRGALSCAHTSRLVRRESIFFADAKLRLAAAWKRKERLTNRISRDCPECPIDSLLPHLVHPQQHHHIRLRRLPSPFNTATMSGVSQLRNEIGSEPAANLAVRSSRTPSTSKPAPTMSLRPHVTDSGPQRRHQEQHHTPRHRFRFRFRHAAVRRGASSIDERRAAILRLDTGLSTRAPSASGTASTGVYVELHDNAED